ncbi:MAG: M48 family metalloprotease [Alphaproteobacteria bacterium]|nr:M48 family metalloprotease [Alphaproteobacteria bacterium]
MMMENMADIKQSMKIFCAGLVMAALLFAPALPARAQGGGPNIIRDTEIENTLKTWVEPLLEASQIDRNGLKIILVESPQVNAFVAGGANIFLYTGLIEKTDAPGELIGVLGHEMGHITGGHLVITRDAMERASYESILGTVLGIGTAIATGNGAAASAIIAGGNSVAQRKFLAHSRVNESSADQAALSFFEKAALDPQGLASFMYKIESEELLPASNQSEYVRTHPLTRDRIEAIEARAKNSPYKDKPLPPEWIEQHARMKAKLVGFINPGRVPWVYDDRDHSVAARYARTIAAYRTNDIDKALAGIDDLLQEEPQNPYFHELKGQMLVDFSRIDEGVSSYREAVKLLPDAPLLRMALAHALIETGRDGAVLEEALKHLRRALKDEPRSARIYRLMATASGRLGEESLAKLYLAEEATLQRRLPYARQQAESALSGLKEGSREWLEAKDLLAHIENLERQAE